ncbi:MAG TPA: sensor histidine kinase, partial [Pseudonocardiaceae bacterium]|nr:sensor histidine kinase [Pseudonocardiaceae bacterium]
MTLPAVVLAAIGVLMVGLIFGFLIGRRAQATVPQQSPDGASAADLVQRVVLSSHNGVVLLNRFGDVVLANAAAVELGLVRGPRPDERAGKAAEQVRATGTVVQVDLSPL